MCSGATRIELCAALSEGGLTPSIGLVKCVRAAVSIPITVLIRPRAGDFLYSGDEFEIMKEDISACKAAGVNGFAIGALTAEGNVDVARVSDLVAVCLPAEMTFHRGTLTTIYTYLAVVVLVVVMIMIAILTFRHH
jgi:copper homeostasis protein